MSHLRIEDVSTAHLRALSLELQDGECIGLSGLSGMGKSLFLRAIADLDPHQGRIWLDGHEQSTVPATEWRSRVTLLAAESAWWAEKVADHFSNTDPDALQQLGFGSECLEWSTERLSSGEKQRLALLRLLAIQPEVLLLDEPTANLDTESAKKVESLIADYRRQHGASVIWVSHDMEQIKRVSNRYYRLERDGLHEVEGQ
jgi:ABC-type iron transport system FetAB ATPase subunit